MSTFSKRINVNPDVLLEYIYDDTNYQSNDYQVITNLKEESKSYQSTTGLNVEDNSLMIIDSVLDKYSKVDTGNFNFLRKQNYSSSLVLYDKVKIYFPSGFDFYDDYLGFYMNVYSQGYDNNKKYSLSNFYYTKDNTDYLSIIDLPRPFLYNGKYWVKSIEFDVPSLFDVSNQRIISNILNEPIPNSINSNLSYGEGLSTNSPIFFDFGFISSHQSILGIDYYYTGDLSSFTIPQSPEFNEVGIVVQESTQGDYFEIYGTYMGSNENMDEFAYNENIKGSNIEIEYFVQLYEENIITTTQTFEVSENFTQKILYRPIIQFSNTTAAIDIEMKIINKVDGSYTSKYGSVGITNSINKYGRTLTRLNLADGVVNSEIYNVKFKNIMQGATSVIDDTLDLVKIPYPVLVDKYRILTSSNNTSSGESKYSSNGMLEIVITSFDTVINFSIAQDINSKDEPIPYNLADLSNNSKIVLSFKSDTEKIEKQIFYEADNSFEIGNIFFKIEESDYSTIRSIYDSGYDNFYLSVNTDSTNTQLYSGKFVFYEDLTFVKAEDTSTILTASTSTDATTIDTNSVSKNISTSDKEVLNTETIDSPEYKTNKVVKENNVFTQSNMEAYEENVATDKNYFNVIIYVRFQTNIDKLDAWLETENITPKIKYSNMYFLERIYATKIVEIKKLEYVEQVYDLKITLGQAPKSITTTDSTTKANSVYRTPVEVVVDVNTPTVKKTPPKSNVVLERVVSNKVVKTTYDNKFTKTSVSKKAEIVDSRITTHKSFKDKLKSKK